MCTHLDDDISINLDARAITCFDACAHMHVFTYAHMLLHAWLVTCVHGRSHYPMLTHECSLVWLLTCLNAHTLSCFHDHMLPRSHSLLIICYYAACFEDNMLSCTHTLIFTCLISTHVHTLGWWYVSMFGTLSDRVVAHLYAQMFWRWHALMHAYIDFHMFDIHTHAHTWLMICLHVRHLKWSCSCTFVCSNALTIMLECIGNWAERGMCSFFFRILNIFNTHTGRGENGFFKETYSGVYLKMPKGMCTWVFQCSYVFMLTCLYSPIHMLVYSNA